LICALTPALVSGFLQPFIAPRFPGFRALTLLSGYGVSFALLAWWEYKFARRESAGIKRGRSEFPTTQTLVAQRNRRAMLAGLILLVATGTAVGRLRAMEAGEAAVIGVVGIISAGYYLWARGSTGRSGKDRHLPEG
jgi:hypothetical protein